MRKYAEEAVELWLRGTLYSKPVSRQQPHACSDRHSGIRAVAAGSLCDKIDRDVPIDSPTQIDYFKATKIREYAKKKGVSTAYLMHRYAISMPYVTTIILGVKNLDELNECLLAEKHGKLTEIEMNEIDQLSQFARL